MGVTAVTNEIRAAGAYARADSLSRAAPIQPEAPRPKFAPAIVGDRQGPSAVDRPEEVGDEQAASQGDGVRRRARPFARPSATFFAQIIAQESDGDTPPVSAFKTGTDAYRAQSQAPAAASAPRVEVIDRFPRLASGHTLDLTV